MDQDDQDVGDDPALDRLLRRLAETPAVDDFAGTARFRVLRRLGAGGFGTVFLVRDLATGAEVALKALTVLRPEALFRFKQEFRTLADLRHPNLVAFYELFAEGSRCYFTMEYVAGPTFLQHVRGPDGLDEGRLRDALGQLASGLAALHRAGRLHRDVKPANALVGPDGRVVLLDFGLATEIGSASGRGALAAGTPAFMSPEDLEGAPLAPATDWYSVGVMLHQALHGRLPHRGPGPELPAAPRRGEPGPSEPPAPPVAPDLLALCRALLEPDPAHRAGLAEVLEVAGRSRPGGHLPGAEPRPHALVGRGDELAALEAALAAVRPGAGVTVLLEGASGSGKTTLVRHFLGRAGRKGAVALCGRCHERERVPYPGVDSLVDDLGSFLSALDQEAAEALLPGELGPLVTLFPVLARVEVVASSRRLRCDDDLDRHALRRLAFGALRELLARIAANRRLVVHLDDLQWCDPDTAALLLEVVQSPGAPGLLLVLSFRSERLESNGGLAALVDGLGAAAQRLALGPLAPDEALALAGQLLAPGWAEADLAAVIAEAGGNPFYLLELARYLARHGQGATAPSGLDLPGALRERIAALPDTARTLLEAVAIAGHPLPEAVARRAAALDGPPWEFWTHLVAGNLVQFLAGAEEGQVEVSHHRILQAVVGGLAPHQVVARHRALAEAIEAHGGADPEVEARHHEAAGDTLAAHRAAVRAATQAEQALAFDRAARLFRWALRLAPADDAVRGPLHAALGRSLASAGRGLEAAEAFREAAALAAPGMRTALEREAALQLLQSGRIDAGRELFLTTLREVGLGLPRSPRRALASLAWRSVLLRLPPLRRPPPPRRCPEPLATRLDHLGALTRGLAMVDVVHGAEAAARFLALASASGDPDRIARARASWVGLQSVLSPWSRRTARELVALDRLVERSGDPRARALTALAHGAHAQSRGPWGSALAAAEAAQRAFTERRLGLDWETWTARTFEVWALFHLGRWRELGARVEGHLAEALDRGNVYATTAMRVPFGLVTWLARGDAESARRQARQAAEGWSVRGFQLQHCWFLLGDGLVDLHQGAGGAAWARVLQRWPALRGSMLLRIPIVRTHLLQLRGACAIAAAGEAVGERRRLLAEAAGAAAALRRIGSTMARLQAELLLATVCAARGRAEAAERRFSEAAPLLEREGLVPWAAAARYRAAELRGERPSGLHLPGAEVADPAAVARMLLPSAPP